MLKLISNWFKPEPQIVKVDLPYGLEHLEVISAEKWFN